MTTRSAPRTRLFFLVACVAAITGLIVVSSAIRNRHATNQPLPIAVADDSVKPKSAPPKNHPLVKPTQFYATSLAEDLPPWIEVTYTDAQIKRESIMRTLLHHDGDLLADQSFDGVRDLVTNDQLFEAKLIARDFDTRLKEIRRERAQVLENAGVTIKDPSEALKQVHIKAFYLYSEVRTRILKEVLTADQRQAISTKFKLRRLAAKAQADRLKAAPGAKAQ